MDSALRSQFLNDIKNEPYIVYFNEVKNKSDNEVKFYKNPQKTSFNYKINSKAKTKAKLHKKLAYLRFFKLILKKISSKAHYFNSSKSRLFLIIFKLSKIYSNKKKIKTRIFSV